MLFINLITNYVKGISIVFMFLVRPPWQFLILYYSAVPGDPQNVQVTPINSTTLTVSWSPPLAKDRNGIIRGYHIHVQETRDEVNTSKISAGARQSFATFSGDH